MSSAVVTPTSSDSLDMKKIFPIFLVVLIDLLGLTIIIPLLPLYAVTFQISPVTVGILNAVYPLSQLVGAPILGRLSDRYGRKPILIISQIGTLVGFLVLGFANTVVLLFISRIIDGFSGGNISTAQAMITDSTNEKTRTQGLGLIGAAFGLGFILGPIIAFTALALSGNDFRVPAFIAAAFAAVSIVLSTFWLKETHDPARREAVTPPQHTSLLRRLQAVRYPHVMVLLLLMFAQQFAFGGLENLLPLFTVARLGLDAANNALVFVFVGVIVVGVQGGLIGRLSRRFGERRLIVAGLALLTLGLALTALTPAHPVPWYSRESLEIELNARSTGDTSTLILPEQSEQSWSGLVWLLVAMVPTSVGAGILQPSINSLITRGVTPNERGTFLGLSSSSLSAANVLTPLIGFSMFQLIGISSPLWLYAGILAVLMVIALRVVKMPPASPA